MNAVGGRRDGTLAITPHPLGLGSALMHPHITIVIPLTPLGELFELSRLPISFLLLIAVIVVLYIFLAEMVKTAFYKKVKF
ncbi:MAG: hypothetical protein ACXWCP_22095 [Burkholderiales bacterium]